MKKSLLEDYLTSYLIISEYPPSSLLRAGIKKVLYVKKRINRPPSHSPMDEFNPFFRKERPYCTPSRQPCLLPSAIVGKRASAFSLFWNHCLPSEKGKIFQSINPAVSSTEALLKRSKRAVPIGILWNSDSENWFDSMRYSTSANRTLSYSRDNERERSPTRLIHTCPDASTDHALAGTRDTE